jgi:PAS domain S-box-containing protein
LFQIELYKKIINNFPDGIIILDECENLLLVNSNVERMFEIEQASWIGKKINYLFSSFTLSGNNPAIENKECVLTRKNSTELCIEIRVNELKSENVRIISVRDISTQKKISNETLKTNERFRGLLNNLDTGIVVHAADSSVIKCNPKAEELLDLSEDQMLGKLAVDPEWKFIDEEHNTLKLEDYPVNQIKRTEQNLEPFVLGVFRPRKSDVVWLTIKGYPVLNKENQLVEIVISFIDITERKALQKQIEREISVKNVFLNSSKDIFWSLDCDLNLITSNETFDNNFLSLYGRNLNHKGPFFQPDLYGQDVIDYWLESYNKVLKGETAFIEYEMPKGQFTDIEWYETKMSPIYLGKDLIGIACFGRNITYRVKSEKKIKASLKEKEILLAEIHHRIKNNLTLIWSLLQLQEMNSNNQEVKDALSESRKRIKSTASIHEMLYKSESLHDIKIKDYLEELFNYLNYNSQIELKYVGDEISVEMDFAMPLGLMMNELFMNSFKHSYNEKSQGTIQVKTTLNENQLTIILEDFEGDFPLDIDFKNAKSTGLILAQTFAEQLNGTLDLIQNCPPMYQIQILINENN